MKKILTAIALIFSVILIGASYSFCSDTLAFTGSDRTDLVSLSRSATVEIIQEEASGQFVRLGTGFFIIDTMIVTCFHVATEGKLIQLGTQTLPGIGFIKKLHAVTVDQDTLTLRPLTQTSDEQRLYDFTILLAPPSRRGNRFVLPVVQADEHLIGQEVLFTGFPIGAQVALTHLGFVSGFMREGGYGPNGLNGDVFCIQSSINGCNSGGALLSMRGEVVGIISAKMFFYDSLMKSIDTEISTASQYGHISLMGQDPLQRIREILLFLRVNSNLGIGYAISSRHLLEYCDKNNLYR